MIYTHLLGIPTIVASIRRVAPRRGTSSWWGLLNIIFIGMLIITRIMIIKQITQIMQRLLVIQILLNTTNTTKYYRRINISIISIYK